MPISVVTIGRQRTVNGLAKTVFGLENASAATVRNAARLLVSANPHLSTDEGLKPGATVIVPNDLQLVPDGSESSAIPIGRERIGEVAMSRISILSAALSAAGKHADAVHDRERDLLGDEELLKAFVESRPALAHDVDRIRKNAAVRAKAADEERDALRKALQRMRKAFQTSGIVYRFADDD